MSVTSCFYLVLILHGGDKSSPGFTQKRLFISTTDCNSTLPVPTVHFIVPSGSQKDMYFLLVTNSALRTRKIWIRPRSRGHPERSRFSGGERDLRQAPSPRFGDPSARWWKRGPSGWRLSRRQSFTLHPHRRLPAWTFPAALPI